MATTTKTVRRTAANTPALARIKEGFNAAFYREALRAWDRGGEADCREQVGRWFREEYRERRLTEIFGD